MAIKTTAADIVATCERALFRISLDPCDPPAATAPETTRDAHTWTPEQDQALLSMRANDMTADDIAGVIDVPASEIAARLVWLMLPQVNTGRSA